jgi:hypothetical protein
LFRATVPAASTRRAPGQQLVLQATALGSPAAGEPGQRTQVVEVVTGDVDRVDGRREFRFGGR